MRVYSFLAPGTAVLLSWTVLLSFNIANGGEPLRVDAHLFPAKFGDLRAEADLGSFVAGEKVAIQVRVINHTSSTIQFDRLRSYRGNAKATTERSSLPADGELTVHVELSVPEDRHEPEQSVVVRFSSKESPVDAASVRLSFQVNQLLRFHRRMADFTLPEAVLKATQRIPLTVTAPLTAEQVQVTGTGDFQDVRGAVIESDGQHWLQFEAAFEDPNQTELAGAFWVRDLRYMRSDMITCLVKQSLPVVVRPAIIFARSSRDNDAFLLTAIVRYVPPNSKSGRVSDSPPYREPAAIVAAHVDNKPVEVVTHFLGGGVFRVEATVPASLADKTEQIEWQVKIGRKVFYVKSRVRY